MREYNFLYIKSNIFFFPLLILISLLYISKSVTIVKDYALSSKNECHPNCEECMGPETVQKHMNCLSCKKGFKFYKITGNCLNCSKFINYEQTDCIETIPEGYYLENKELGTLGKCHEYCKTCDGPPMPYGMQCIECKYKVEKFKPVNESDCPGDIDDEEEEHPPEITECPRDEPILVGKDNCSMVYCSEQEFKDSLCKIYNPIIQIQWINKILRFGEGEIGNICLDYGYNGELVLFGQKKDEDNNETILQIYFINKDQTPDENSGNYTYFKKINFPYDVTFDKIKLVKNIENGNLKLISTQINNKMYVIDYLSNKITEHKFEQISYNSKSSDIILIKELKDVYLTNFIYCNDENDCHGYLRQFKFKKENNDINIIKEYFTNIKINPEKNFICIESFPNYIQCTYTTNEENKKILGLFDINSLEEKFLFEIESELNNKTFLDSMSKLNDQSFIIAYSLKNNIIKVLLKYIDYDSEKVNLALYDFIQDISFVTLNENNYYTFEGGEQNRNSLCVLNDNKFAFLLNNYNNLPKNNYENSEIIIYILNIFNNNKNINIRKYSINFKLYNMINKGKLLGYTLDNFFGSFIELSSPENKNITNAGFITFGYINLLKDNYKIFDSNFFPPNSSTSNPISLKNYFENKLHNNLFDYTFNGAIILALNDNNSGYFYTGSHYKIIISQVLNLNSDIRFELGLNFTPGNYSIEFAGVVSEPNYKDMDKFAEEVIHYPNNTDISEKDFYKPKLLTGRKIVYTFEVKEGQLPKPCYPSCLSCQKYTLDDNNQMCIECKQSYYFINGTQNCFNYAKNHYYFDNETKKYYPCYKDCLTCDKKEISIYNMNCLSCSNQFKFYQKSKNCLNCPKYVNLDQTQCISEIPEGYYLSNEKIGSIEKCYSLCKTCSKGPENIPDKENNAKIHMNCDSCLYENKNFTPSEDGECPSSSDPIDEEEPIDGICPKNKPILKNNKCKNIYCTKIEFEEGICKVNNNILKIQWLNKINNFPKDASNIRIDKSENGDLFLLAQKKEGENINMFLYGFNKNNEGYFYEKSKNNYESFKKLLLKSEKIIEKIKYLEFGNQGYLLNIFKDRQIHLIDFNSAEHFTYTIPYVPSSLDKFERYDNSKTLYLYDYIYCNKNEKNIYETCYMGLSNYEVNSKYSIKEQQGGRDIARVKSDSKLICINNVFSSDLILCKYNVFEPIDDEYYRNKHTLGLFTTSHILKNIYILDDFFLYDKQIFDTMASMNKNNSIFIIVFSTSKNIIKILFKTLKNNLTDLEDCIPEVPYIYINKDLKYDLSGNIFSNDLCKMDDNNYFLIIGTNNNKDDSNNTGLLIISLIIDNFSKVILKYYHIDLNLYGIKLGTNFLSYDLNGFLGVLFEINSSLQEIGNSAFLTFGFVNTTNEISIEEGTQNLLVLKKNLKIKDYISEIENNLFGYEIIGVEIIDIPDQNKVGAFIDLNDKHKLINKNDIINISSELHFNQVSEPIIGNYKISFYPKIKEPSKENEEKYFDLYEYYPSNSTKEYDYIPRIFSGKIFNYNFAIKNEEKKCFQNCEDCLYISEDVDNQSCLKCKTGFYFVHNTHNCFDKLETKYYFNNTSKEYYPCYRDCLTCDSKEENSTHMNCLTCSKPLRFYEKNKNCLSCYNFVNYEQTGCINSIPEGYYLKDKDGGIIDKCYKFCKTCNGKEYKINDILHMNCDTCLFKNNSRINIERNCPEKDEPEEEKNENIEIEYIIVGIAIILIIITAVWIYLKLRKKRSPMYMASYSKMGGKTVMFDDEDDDNDIN